jgi:hypothetical protein
VLVLLGAGSVAAAPDNRFTVDVDMYCPDAGGLLTLVRMDSQGSARWIEGTTSVFVAVSVIGEVTIDGVTFPYVVSTSEQRLEHQDLTTCFVDDTFVLVKSGQVVTIVATVQAIITPRTS